MKNFTEIFSWLYAAMHAWSGASYKGRVVDKHFIEWHLIAFFLPPIHTPHYPRSYLTSDVLQDMVPAAICCRLPRQARTIATDK